MNSASALRPGRAGTKTLPPISPSWLSAILLVAPLSVLGELLIAHTNHRPLGAATFATIAAVLWAFAEILSRRVLSPEISARRVRARKAVWIVSLCACTLVLIRALF